MLLLGGLACNSDPLLRFGEDAASRSPLETPVTTGNPSSATQPPSVSRFQKPDNDPSRPPTVSLTSYQTAGGRQEVAARIRATVNAVPIMDEEVKEVVMPVLLQIRNMPEPQRTTQSKEILEKALQQLIDREVVLQTALTRLKDRPQVMDKLKDAAAKEADKRLREIRKGNALKSDEELKAWLSYQGMTVAGVRRQIEREFMANEYLKNLIVPMLDKIGLQEIADYYRQHPEEFQQPDTVDWQDIFIDAQEFPSRDAAQQFADKLAALARAGEDFLRLEAQYNKGPSRYSKGEGTGHRRGEIRPAEAEPILFQLKEGEIGPVIALGNGFHVVRVVKRQYAGLRPYDEKTQTAIKNKLQYQVWEREKKHLLDELRSKASIEVSTR
jgi:parvulin-like peptidyl-prolyl isomerase